MRVALLSGRRYENFKSAEDFQVFAAHSWTSLTLAEPIPKESESAKIKRDWGELVDAGGGNVVKGGVGWSLIVAGR